MNAELLLIHSVRSDNYEQDVKDAEAQLEMIGKQLLIVKELKLIPKCTSDQRKIPSWLLPVKIMLTW